MAAMRAVEIADRHRTTQALWLFRPLKISQPGGLPEAEGVGLLVHCQPYAKI
jgi:hypothetical protein